MKIYVASSWRNNDIYPVVVKELKKLGHRVYDFKKNGFSWRELGPNWDQMPIHEILAHPTSRAGFSRDWEALKDADAVVLVLPCNRSAHLELGYAVGAGKKSVVLQLEKAEPELMYLMCDHIFTNMGDLVCHFG